MTADLYVGLAIFCFITVLTVLVNKTRPGSVLDDASQRAEAGADKQWGLDLAKMAAEIKLAKTLHRMCVSSQSQHGADAHLDEARDLVRGGAQ
jgi:hypothetical protein